MPAQRMGVDAKTFQTFASLFLIGRERKGPLRWDEFEKAMSDVGFVCKAGKSGASVDFIPVSAPVSGTFSCHKPHSKRKGRPMLDKKGKKLLSKALYEVYEWDRDTFVLRE
ncbi:hypothetical protein OH77DRAFT_540661 [Trametes cingulata]|nr:hypothetical protein OH77DRAFT_540661 [Trametes cingulata]